MDARCFFGRERAHGAAHLKQWLFAAQLQSYAHEPWRHRQYRATAFGVLAERGGDAASRAWPASANAPCGKNFAMVLSRSWRRVAWWARRVTRTLASAKRALALRLRSKQWPGGERKWRIAMLARHAAMAGPTSVGH